MIIRPAMYLKVECFAVKKQYIQKISVAEVRILRWMSRNTNKD